MRYKRESRRRLSLSGETIWARHFHGHVHGRAARARACREGNAAGRSPLPASCQPGEGARMLPRPLSTRQCPELVFSCCLSALNAYLAGRARASACFSPLPPSPLPPPPRKTCWCSLVELGTCNGAWGWACILISSLFEWFVIIQLDNIQIWREELNQRPFHWLYSKVSQWDFNPRPCPNA